MGRIPQILIMFCLTVALSGCSLLPRITFDKPNSVPQSIEKTNHQTRCAGELKIGEDGSISCSKGYYSNEKDSSIKERKLTLKEKILNFVSNLQGWFFWIFLALLIFCPGIIGWLFGSLFNGARTALTATIRGIQKAKNNGVNLSPEERVKYQETLNEVLGMIYDEHKNDPNTVKLIDSIRTELKIKEKL